MLLLFLKRFFSFLDGEMFRFHVFLQFSYGRCHVCNNIFVSEWVKWGSISRFRNNHELFKRFLGLPSNGNRDNIHTSAACSSTVLEMVGTTVDGLRHFNKKTNNYVPK